ncbi:MAG TPA: hypothetical protein VJS69_01220 [Candidatus Krumholzibacteria bacterium]|nr:hypothetical protein [Candidatus Krumholzibacteria bacterium]
MRTFLALVLAVSLAACGDSTSTPPIDLNGTWSGGLGSQMVTLTLLDNNGNVSGSGTITNTPTGTRAQVVTGVFTKPAFTLTLSSGSAQPVSFSGTYHPSIPAQLVGTFVGSGFTGDAIILNKQ